LYKGVVEKAGTQLVSKILTMMLKPQKTLSFYDIGANTGYYGIMAAFLGKGKINTFAFEPIQEFSAIEQESIKCNHLEKNVTIFNCALGNTDSQQSIFISGSGTSLNKQFQSAKPVPERVIHVRRLDDLIEQDRLPAPDFLKIDVESLEYEVLLGAKLTLESAKPVVWYESALTVKQNNYTNDNFFATQELLSGLGYEIFLQQGKGLVKTGRAVGDGVEMYLALHREKHNFILKNFEIVEK
jgi:FkbM family methyltransferase